MCTIPQHQHQHTAKNIPHKTDKSISILQINLNIIINKHRNLAHSMQPNTITETKLTITSKTSNIQNKRPIHTDKELRRGNTHIDLQQL